ncbi:MAG: hypothetical protein ACRCX1_10940, partial [Bacteroidales bacterium]
KHLCNNRLRVADRISSATICNHLQQRKSRSTKGFGRLLQMLQSKRLRDGLFQIKKNSSTFVIKKYDSIRKI